MFPTTATHRCDGCRSIIAAKVHIFCDVYLGADTFLLSANQMFQDHTKLLFTIFSYYLLNYNWKKFSKLTEHKLNSFIECSRGKMLFGGTIQNSYGCSWAGTDQYAKPWSRLQFFFAQAQQLGNFIIIQPIIHCLCFHDSRALFFISRTRYNRFKSTNYWSGSSSFDCLWASWWSMVSVCKTYAN